MAHAQDLAVAIDASAAQSHLLNVLIHAHLVQLVLADCCHQVYVPIKVEHPVPVELVRCL